MAKSLEYTPELLARLDQINRMLVDVTTKVLTLAWNTYQKLCANPCLTNQFNDFTVTPQLYVPSCDFLGDIRSEVDEDFWFAIRHSANGCVGEGVMMGGHSLQYSQDPSWQYRSLDDYIDCCVWGKSVPSEPTTTWGHDCHLDEEAVKDICFCTTFHELCSHRHFPIDMLLKLPGLQPNVRIEYFYNNRNEDDED